MGFVRALLHELRYTIRSRDVIIMLALGPVLLTLLFGGTYMNTYVDDIPIAVLDEDGSSLSRSIIQHFEENERFRVAALAGNIEEMKQMVSSGKISMGVCIPPNFYGDVARGTSSQVLIIVDGANLVVGNNSYSAAASIIQTIAAGAGIKRVQAKGVLEDAAKSMTNPFMFNDRMLYNPKLSYLNYLLLGYVAVFLQQVMLSGVGIQMIKGGTSIAGASIAGAVLLKILACAFYALLSVAAAIGAAAYVFHVNIRGSVPAAMAYCLLYAFAISGPAIIIAAIVKDKLKYMQLSYMLSLPSFISCGYIWPQDQMPQALVILLKCIWPLINFARPFSLLLCKGVFSIEAFLELVIYTVIWLPAAVWFFNYRYGRRTEGGSLTAELPQRLPY